MRKCTLLLFTLIPALLNAQTLPGTVNIKTPEATAFDRNIETPVSMYTGIPNISIPLYEVAIKGVTLPISLNYNAGGIRVDQEATWVGLGWSLNYQGEISRKVRGIPDENFFLNGINNSSSSINYFNQLPAPNNQADVELRQSYIIQAKAGGKDYMPDAFYYSLPGYSGKFMFSQEQNKFILFPKEDIAITNDGNQLYSWNAKLPNGVSIDLGEDAFSRLQLNGTSNSPKNTWSIKRINNTNNESINFSYDAFNYTSFKLTGSTFTFDGASSSNNTNIDRFDYTDTRIKTITFPEGTVNFVTASRADMPTTCLSEINVIDKQGNSIKKIRFYYSYFYAASYDIMDIFGLSSTNTIITYAPPPYRYNRLRLDSLTVLSNDLPASRKTYKFSYYEKAQMPSKFSFSQDHWGFYNGIANTGIHSFIPNIMPGMFQGGDRRVKPENSNVFSLKTMTYPEGGATEFVYENNTAGVWDMPAHLSEYYQDDNVINKEAGMSISSFSRTTANPYPDYTSNATRYFKKQFSIPPTGYMSLGTYNWECSTNFGISTAEQYMSAYENNVRFLLEKIESNGTRVFIKEFTTTPGSPNSSGIYQRNGVSNEKINLSVGNYEMTVALTYLGSGSIAEQPYNLYFTLKWRELDPAKQMINVGGLRIKDINYYTSEGVLAKKKHYSYINPYNEQVSNFTSGRVVSFTKYYQVRHRLACTEGPTSGCAVYKDVVCYSNSVAPLETTSGSYLGYDYVNEEEIDVTNTNNSYTTAYHFSFNPPYFSQFYPYLGQAAYEPAEWTRGKLLSKTVYKKGSIIQKEENEYYAWSPHLANATNEDYVQEINTDLISRAYLHYTQIMANQPADFYDRVVADRPDNINWAIDNECISFKYGAGNHQVIQKILGSGSIQYMCIPINVTLPYFSHYTGFDRLKTRIVTNIDDNGNQLKQTENYYYQKTPTHNQLTKTETLNSAQETLTSALTYAADYPTTAPYNTMIQKHMLNVPVEQLNHKNTTFLRSAKTNYQDWGNNIIAPVTIEEKRGTNPSTIMGRYHGYDANGNILSLSKEFDVRATYLWGYNHAYVVAKVAGADYATVSSFINQAILDNPASDQQLRDELNKVRIGLAGNTALVTTYTYAPLVGITSETAPIGKTIYYEYDGFGRLKLIKDQDQNIIKTFQYHFKNN